MDRIDDPKVLPVPESDLRALDEAIEDYERDPEDGKSWDEARDEFLRK